MAFKDWAELDGHGDLELPIRGKTYRIPSPPGRVGLRVQAFMQLAVDAAKAQENGQPVQLDEEILDDANELELYQDVLGPARQEMLDDGVPTEAVKHATLTAMMWIAFDRATAEAVWEGKAPAAAVRSRKAAAATTPKPASGSGMSTRRASARKAAKASPGRKSSRTGR